MRWWTLSRVVWPRRLPADPAQLLLGEYSTGKHLVRTAEAALVRSGG